MSEGLNKIRKPIYVCGFKKVVYPIILLACGIVLGIFSKVLDETASNILPTFFWQLDLGNFFSRIGVWMFMGVCISLYSKTPFRAALNILLFFTGMVGSYYIYTIAVAGFFPKSYMMIWVAMTLLSPFLGMVCWYARGVHIVSVLISSVIFMMLARQAFCCGFWYFDISYPLEFVLFLATIIILYDNPKQIAKVAGLGVMLFLLTSQMNLFFGML